MTYRCVDGDRIDLVVLAYYGSLEHLNNVIASNKHLFNEPLDLRAGMVINLPEFIEVEDYTLAGSTIREPLW
ncbi:MAG: tail protein X [Sulfurospirillum sp.]|nr:tail protein X [Sulfurospirillum sp.]